MLDGFTEKSRLWSRTDQSHADRSTHISKDRLNRKAHAVDAISEEYILWIRAISPDCANQVD